MLRQTSTSCRISVRRAACRLPWESKDCVRCKQNASLLSTYLVLPKHEQIFNRWPDYSSHTTQKKILRAFQAFNYRRKFGTFNTSTVSEGNGSGDVTSPRVYHAIYSVVIREPEPCGNKETTFSKSANTLFAHADQESTCMIDIIHNTRHYFCSSDLHALFSSFYSEFLC